MSVFSELISRESEKLGEPVEKIVELPRMRVPLLIIRYSSGLSIDIQFPEENYHAIRNTNLIRTYKAVQKELIEKSTVVFFFSVTSVSPCCISGSGQFAISWKFETASTDCSHPTTFCCWSFTSYRVNKLFRPGPCSQF